MNRKFTCIILLAGLAAVAPGARRAEAQIQRIGTETSLGLSKAVVVPAGELVFSSQVFPLEESGEVDAKGDASAQIRLVLKHLSDALNARLQGGLHDVAKLAVYLRSADDLTVVRKTIASAFPENQLPAVSYVVTALRVPNARVCIDAVAVVRRNDKQDQKAVVQFNELRKSAKVGLNLGTYGNLVDRSADMASLPARSLILVSGQAEPGELRESISKTWLSLIKTVEWAAGTSGRIGHVKVFMSSVDDATVVFDEISNATKDSSQFLPPISFVQWTNKGPTEIEVIAAGGDFKSDDQETVRQLNPPWMTESPVYCKVAVTNSDRLIFTSGLYGKPASDSEAQINAMFTELDQLMKSAGSDLKHLAKATYYVANDEVSGKLNTLRPKYYDPKHPPAASKASVTSVGAEGCTITLDMIAVPIAK